MEEEVEDVVHMRVYTSCGFLTNSDLECECGSVIPESIHRFPVRTGVISGGSHTFSFCRERLEIARLLTRPVSPNAAACVHPEDDVLLISVWKRDLDPPRTLLDLLPVINCSAANGINQRLFRCPGNCGQ